jgi:hypothetical protein
MSRREDFARAVDGDATGAGTAVADLAGIATALRTMSRSVALPEPDPQFRSDLRQRLVAVATVQDLVPAQSGDRPPSRVAGRRTPQGSARAVPRGRRTIVALAGTVAVLGSFTGVALAASHSLPGSPFYDVKRATESVQLFAARGQLDKGHRQLEFAATRLGEARSLSPTSSHLPSTLDTMDAETRSGTNDLVSAARSSHSVAPLNELRSFTHSQYAGLQALINASPPAVRQREIRSVNLLAGIDAQAAALSAASTGSGSGPAGGGLGGLLNGGLPAPGSSAPGQPGLGGGIVAPTGHPGGGSAPVPTPSNGRPVPRPSLPVTIPTTLPSVLPKLPTTLPTLPITIPTTLPTTLPSLLRPLPSTLPTLLPSLLPSLKP